MSIKFAKQNGSRVTIQREGSSTSVNGTLIGFTQKTVFVADHQWIKLYTDDGKSFKGVGRNIFINGAEPIMCGQYVGLKKGHLVSLYDETGKAAGHKTI